MKKSWRPISIGTSECWILEKIFQRRLAPYMMTNDCQFGYKSKHSATHAIQIVRVIEKERDVHACLLDASSAFDRLSWTRIRNSFIKRRIPPVITKLILIQLSLTKISVCNTQIFFARAGVKQGGILSGVIFSACYDILVDLIKSTRAGVLLKNADNLMTLIQILIYADDIILFSLSPYGLKIRSDGQHNLRWPALCQVASTLSDG